MTNKKLIAIVKTPEGPGIPEEIRKGWIGIIFQAEGPKQIVVGPAINLDSEINPEENYGPKLVYSVSSELALMALKYWNRKSWEWIARQPKIAPIFDFNVDCCREIILPRLL